jgi:hypothetical protein
MSASAASQSAPPRVPRGLFSVPRLRRDGADLVVAAVTVGAAVVAALALARGHHILALAVAVIPLVAIVLTRPTIPLIALAAALPSLASITHGGNGAVGSGGYNATVSDVLLVLVGAGIFTTWIMGRSEPVVRALRPVALPMLQYCGLMILLLAVHPGLHEFFKTAQRFELFLLPVVVGAFAALTGWHIRMLKAYVLASTVLAVVWPFHHIGNHNPVGQVIANAILLLVGVRALRRFFPCLVFLVPGLVFTVSRGAIVATLIGLMVILVLQRTRARPVVTRLLPVSLVAVAAFAVSPSSLQSRLTTFHAGKQTTGEYALYLREKYADDAHQIIDAHPWAGVGIGNYGAADSLSSTPVQDPHQVLLLQEAEGGYVFGASFIVLIAGVMLALRRIRQVDVGPAAAGILIATAAHGVVDVYWVRGTPVLSWLLVGMACGGLAQLRRSSAGSA